MDCKHELKKLVGTAEGIVCTGCGKVFDHIPKQGAKAEPAPEKDAKPVKKATARKTPAKKGEK